MKIDVNKYIKHLLYLDRITWRQKVIKCQFYLYKVIYILLSSQNIPHFFVVNRILLTIETKQNWVYKSCQENGLKGDKCYTDFITYGEL